MMMRNAIVWMAGAVAMGACSAAPARQQTTPTLPPATAENESGMIHEKEPGSEGMSQGGMGSEAEMARMCPMGVPGTTAYSQDTDKGVAIVFTTTSGDVTELRRRVAHMAAMHNQHMASMEGRSDARQPDTTPPPDTTLPEPTQPGMGNDRTGTGSGTGSTTGQTGSGTTGSTVGQGGTSADQSGSGQAPGMSDEDQLMHARARAEDIEGGARIVFEPSVVGMIGTGSGSSATGTGTSTGSGSSATGTGTSTGSGSSATGSGTASGSSAPASDAVVLDSMRRAAREQAREMSATGRCPIMGPEGMPPTSTSSL